MPNAHGLLPKKINLALQGGGAHGAYTWGVLDRLLEEEAVIIEGISGTSAGAMNAAMLISGYMKGGREGAREALATFWKRVAESTATSMFNYTPIKHLVSGFKLDMMPAYQWIDMFSRLMSPYTFNPFNVNPIRTILEDSIDFEALAACSTIRLFVTATHVASGQARIFHCHEVNADVLLASACIPFLFQAVEIEGEPYWDGGYMGNPAIWPIIYGCESRDVLLVQINPIHNDKLPRSAHNITDRLNEITFNSSLIAEMRAIDFVRRLLEEGRLDPERYKAMRIHLVYSPEEMKKHDFFSKMNADWDFFQHLKVKGREAADQWLRESWSDVGKKSTVDIREKFLTGPGWNPRFSDKSNKEAKKHKK